MTSQDLQILDTLGTSDYIKGELSDDGKRSQIFILWLSAYSILELDIPPHMIPPNPDDSDSSSTVSL
jgi:hypothetical protein